jgi:Ca2+-transporting ATPase
MKRERQEWYAMTGKQALERLKSSESGLDPEEAAKRLKADGPNVLRSGKTHGIFDRLVEQLKNPLAFILLCAGIVTVFLSEYVNSGIIFTALSINVLIGLYQEGRAGKAFDKLKDSQKTMAVVIRGGEKRLIPSAEVVVGDALVIETGMKIAADARLLRAVNLTVNESMLTGEWLDVEKSEEPQNGPLAPNETKNCVYAGSLVSSGSGTALVFATGERTELGAIAKSLDDGEEGKTPLQEEIAKVARVLSWLILGSIAFIFLLGALRGESFSALILIAVAIAVSAIPEGLPAAVTVVLAVGMEAILARGGLVRNLLAAETLGSTTVILTDKTGTLTKADMEVTDIITWGSIVSRDRHAAEGATIVHEAHGDERDVLEFAALASDAFIDTTGGKLEVHGRPVERAVVSAALSSGLNQTRLLENYPRLDFLAFSSSGRFGASLNDVRGITPNRYHMTGAPEYMLESAEYVYFEGKAHRKTPDMVKRFEAEHQAHTEKGMRLIGVAMKDTDKRRFEEGELLDRSSMLVGSTFCGFIALSDPIRPDVKESIRTAQKAGARVIMATGDNKNTAIAIATECGIYHDGDGVLTGDEIAKLSEEELGEAMKHTSVLARMLPESKLRIARLLEGKGEIVAMTGDGVNDAPTLRAANIGVALGSGTEVAKEASDIVLLHNSFSVIVAAIEEGRRVIDNLRKVVVFLLSTSFGEIFVVSGAMLAAAPMPVLPAQILWINMLTEGLLNFAYAFEPAEPDVMRRHPRRHGKKGLMSRSTLSYIVLCAASTGLLLYALFAIVYLWLGWSIEETRALIFITLFVSAVAGAISIKDLHIPVWKMELFSNTYLLLALGVAFLGLGFALFVPPLTHLLSLEALRPMPAVVVGVVMFITILAIHEAGKMVLFERRKDA